MCCGVGTKACMHSLRSRHRSLLSVSNVCSHTPCGPFTGPASWPRSAHGCPGRVRTHASFLWTHSPCKADPKLQWAFPRALVGTAPCSLLLSARCSAAGPRGVAAFPGRKLQKRKEELESHDPSILGALPVGKSGTRAEPFWKICCNHYLCSFSIMRVNGSRERPTDRVNTDLLRSKRYWKCFQFSNTLAVC